MAISPDIVRLQGNAYEADFGQAIFNCMIGPSSADWRIPYHFEVQCVPNIWQDISKHMPKENMSGLVEGLSTS